MVTTWQEAEFAAEAYMRFLGFEGAECTPPGADAGVDVRHAKAVAQVKWHAKVVGRGDLQKLNGAVAGKQKLFFSRSGYSKPAHEFAAGHRIALFTFDGSAVPMPSNDVAVKLVEKAPGGSPSDREFQAAALAAEWRRVEQAEAAAAREQSRRDEADALRRQRLAAQQARRDRSYQTTMRQTAPTGGAAPSGRTAAPDPSGPPLWADRPDSAVAARDTGDHLVPSTRPWGRLDPVRTWLTTWPHSWWVVVLWLYVWLTIGVLVGAAWLVWQIVCLSRRAVRWVAATRSGHDQRTAVEDDAVGKPFVIDPRRSNPGPP